MHETLLYYQVQHRSKSHIGQEFIGGEFSLSTEKSFSGPPGAFLWHLRTTDLSVKQFSLFLFPASSRDNSGKYRFPPHFPTHPNRLAFSWQTILNRDLGKPV